VYFVLEKQAFCIASSMKKQFTGRHVAPLGYIILISGEAANTIYIVFGLTQSGTLIPIT
jgi:hypothetical protein